MSDSGRIAYLGSKLAIVWIPDESGRYRGEDFFHSVSEAERAKTLAMFRRLADHGRIHDPRKFKKLEGTAQLWEFKIRDIRLIGSFRFGGKFIIALGVRKKKSKHKSSDLDKASRILDAFDESQEAQ